MFWLAHCHSTRHSLVAVPSQGAVVVVVVVVECTHCMTFYGFFICNRHFICHFTVVAQCFFLSLSLSFLCCSLLICTATGFKLFAVAHFFPSDCQLCSCASTNTLYIHRSSEIIQFPFSFVYARGKMRLALF